MPNQTPPSLRRGFANGLGYVVGQRILAPGFLGLSLTGAAWSQEAAGARFWSFQPAVSIRQVVTDNHKLSTPREADTITELGAGLRVASQGSSLRGSLDYQLTGLAYARHSDENTVRHQLAAEGKAEIAEGSAYVDLRASVSEQTVSAFGVLSTDGSRPSSNKDRVISLAAAPYIQGRMGSLFDYLATIKQETARFREKRGFGFDRTSVGLGLVGGGVPVSWAFNADHRRTRYRFGDYADESKAVGSLRYQVGTDLRLGVSAGIESSEFGEEPTRGKPIYGVTANWTPTQRTDLRLSTTKEHFGTSHGLELTHRFERLVVAFSDRRDLSTGSIQGLPTAGVLTSMLASQGGAVVGNPALAEFAARDFLVANGVDPDAQAISGFIANATTVSRTQSLVAVWRGLRTTLSVRLAQGWSEQLDKVSGPVTDFQFSSILRQRGVVADLAYNPSPVSSISLNGTWQRNTGDDPAPTTELKSLGLGWVTRPSTHSTWSAGARYTVFNSPTSPYRERAGYLAYRLQF